MTHAELVQVAARWLRGTAGCGVVLTETGCTYLREVPDAIGFKAWGWSILVECKTSRADFRVDRAKVCRVMDGALGQERWYLAPAGIIPLDEVPASWGLLEHDPATGRVRKAKWCPRSILAKHGLRAIEEKTSKADCILLLAALRRVQMGGDAAEGILRQLHEPVPEMMP